MTSGSGMAIQREVVVTPYGERYHRLPLTGHARPKDAACGGFVQMNLSRIPQSEAEKQGYTACQNCDWTEVPKRVR